MSIISLFSGSFCRADEIVPRLLERTGYALVTDDEIVHRASEISGVSYDKLARPISAKTSVFNSFTGERERSISLLRYAVAERLQDEQAAGREMPPHMAGTFRDSVGRALASLGDQLFWLGLRPTIVLVICLAGLLGQISSILAVVGIFALGQLLVRWISLRVGYDLGLDIADLLLDRRWHIWINRTKRIGMILTGVVAGLYLSQVAASGAGSEKSLLWIGTALGMGLPVVLRKRLPGEILVLAALALALLLTFAISALGS